MLNGSDAGIRELFIEELAEVEGGAQNSSVDVELTTQACCEELILGTCCL